MNDYFAALQAAVAACVDQATPAHWLLASLILFLVLMLVVYWFEDYWLAVEHAFQAQGVGRDSDPTDLPPWDGVPRLDAWLKKHGGDRS